MKTTALIALTVLIFGFNSCAEKDTDVPEVVMKSFTSKFPDAQEIEWEKEDDNEWEAEFELLGTEYTASFDSKGSWLETERYVKEADLPQIVLENLKANYPDHKIEEIAFVENETNSYYEIDLAYGDETTEVAISEDGNSLSSNETEDDDNEDD
jgi:hypothetical protein